MGHKQSTAKVVAPTEVHERCRRTKDVSRLGIQTHRRHSCAKSCDHVKKNSVTEIELYEKEKAENTKKEREHNVVDIKAQNDFRADFPRELSYENVWKPKVAQSPKQQTILIFDWDDTLLCTTFLQMHRSEDSRDKYLHNVKQIVTSVIKLLESAMRMGHTFIITNASDGWVEESAKKWAPDLLPVLEKIRIISARTKYEPYFPDEMEKWKTAAFLDIQKQFDSQIITNLVSLGDSKFEWEAVQVMRKQFARAFVKTFKFLKEPSPKELLVQLQLANNQFEQIVGKSQDMNANFNMSKK